MVVLVLLELAVMVAILLLMALLPVVVLVAISAIMQDVPV